MSKKNAIIIGAGPAGLTAALELLEKTQFRPIVLEISEHLGGISRTVNYKGNRIDLGGHRFFSKSDRVMDWWLQQMPLQKLGSDKSITYQQKSRYLEVQVGAPDPNATDRVMLVRRRKSRIFFLRKFFDYPLRLNADTVVKLGPIRLTKIALSYAWASLFATKNPKNLEEFFISRFGRELYLTFFKSYTEKVWGVNCTRISAEWGAQRIKGLSISKAMLHFLKTLVSRRARDISQKNSETSLIEEFLYPKYGPGQMWETVADEVTRRGGEVLLNQRATKIHVQGNRVTSVNAVDMLSGEIKTYPAEYVFSTMPVKELIDALDVQAPQNVREVSSGLVYRDFITVGLLLKRLKIVEHDRKGPRPITDNWIYIQEADVKVGRIQIFNNWSPYMVADPATVWIGLEYFCSESDDLWNLPDKEMLELAKTELARMGFIDIDDFLDGTVIRMPKTYPAYFGTFNRFGEIQEYVDQFVNLFLIGRNGMHKYNNQDHSMLTAMTAVDNIISGRIDKSNIWEVNTEREYHESKED